jgi:hypothetical protein
MIVMRQCFRLLGLILFVGLCIISCSPIRNVKPCNTSDFWGLDSLAFLGFPNDNLSYEGNAIFKRIMTQADSIQSCVIEKIRDTTSIGYKVEDTYVYTVSDMAILLLPHISKGRINRWDLLYDEFKIARKSSVFYQAYYDVFFNNEPMINYKNRIRFYSAAKKKYSRELRKRSLPR